MLSQKIDEIVPGFNANFHNNCIGNNGCYENSQTNKIQLNHAEKILNKSTQKNTNDILTF